MPKLEMNDRDLLNCYQGKPERFVSLAIRL